MLKEDCVSYETAKLLKEKGFDAYTEHNMWYVVEEFSTGCHWNSCTYKVGDITREYDKECCIVIPTLQMAMKWLREVHNIDVTITPDRKENYTAMVFVNKELPFTTIGSFKTHEVACDAAIKYCIENLI